VGHTAPTPPDEQATTAPDPRRWQALILLSAAQFMVILNITVVNLALPSIGADLALDRAALTWVVTTYTLFFGGLLPGGRLADLLGRRRTFLAGLGVFTAASLTACLAGDGSVLIAARAWSPGWSPPPTSWAPPWAWRSPPPSPVPVSTADRPRPDAVFAHALAKANTALDAEVIDHGAASEALSRLIRSSWPILAQHRGRLAAAQRDLPPARIRQRHDQTMARVERLIARGQDEGDLRVPTCPAPGWWPPSWRPLPPNACGLDPATAPHSPYTL
jgi:hypothetical protein